MAYLMVASVLEVKGGGVRFTRWEGSASEGGCGSGASERLSAASDSAPLARRSPPTDLGHASSADLHLKSNFLPPPRGVGKKRKEKSVISALGLITLVSSAQSELIISLAGPLVFVISFTITLRISPSCASQGEPCTRPNAAGRCSPALLCAYPTRLFAPE